MLHDSTSRDIGQKPRAGAPPLSPLLMLLFFGFGAVFSFFFIVFLFGCCGFGFHCVVIHFVLLGSGFFSAHYSMASVWVSFQWLANGFAYWFCFVYCFMQPFKVDQIFFGLFPTYGLFLLYCNFLFEFVVEEPTPRLFELCNLFSSPIFLI
jgi:hypothetical protein